MSTFPTTSSASFASHGGPGPRLMTAATLEGDKVVNLQNHLLGTVRDITVDVSTGQIAHVLIVQEGQFGVAEKMFVVPWQSLTLDPMRKCFVMDMSRDQLSHAPTLDQGRWPEQGADPQWVEQLHSYFSAPPL